MIGAGDGFAKLTRQVHRCVMDEKGLFQMNHIRPSNGFFYLRPVPVGVVITERIEHRLHKREVEIVHPVLGLFTIRLVDVRTG